MNPKEEINSLRPQLDRLCPQGYMVGLHIRMVSPILTLQAYPQEWLDHYSKQAYALRDPVVAWGLSQTGATRWSAIDLPDPFNVIGEAAKFGLAFGACISCGEITSRTIAGVARADREFNDEEIAEISGIILRMHHLAQPPENLTKAEIEALGVLASGDRYAAGAEKLGISESALKARLASARTKLFARTSAEAIQRAQEYRLI